MCVCMGGGGAIEEGGRGEGGGGGVFYCHIKIAFFLIVYVFESSPLKAWSRLL